MFGPLLFLLTVLCLWYAHDLHKAEAALRQVRRPKSRVDFTPKKDAILHPPAKGIH